MRLLSFIALLAIIIPVNGQNHRQLYEEASKSEIAYNSALQFFTQAKLPSEVKEGYLAAMKCLSAKYTINPASKISRFKAGTGALEKVINTNPQNIELRYLRYTIQTNAPAMLGYNHALKEDTSFLYQYSSNSATVKSDPDLYKRIASFLIQFSSLDLKQKQLLKIIHQIK